MGAEGIEPPKSEDPCFTGRVHYPTVVTPNSLYCQRTTTRTLVRPGGPMAGVLGIGPNTSGFGDRSASIALTPKVLPL